MRRISARGVARCALAVAVLCAASASCAATGGSGGGAAGPALHSRAPDFTLSDLEGEELRLADHLGRSVIVINFWATWCEPCRIEMPHLDRMQQQYAEQGLLVLSINMDGPESVARVRSQVSRYGFAVRVLLDQESGVTSLYNPRRAAPFSIVIDRAGEIVWTREGYNPGDERELEAEVARLLSAPNG